MSDILKTRAWTPSSSNMWSVFQRLQGRHGLSYLKSDIVFNITHHAVVKWSEQAMCSLSAWTPLWLIEAIGDDSGVVEELAVKPQSSKPLCSFFGVCVCVCQSSSEVQSCCQPHYISLFSETPFKVAAGLVSHYVTRASPIHSPTVWEDLPLLQSRSLFYSCFCGSLVASELHQPPPLHFICILFLGLLISPLSCLLVSFLFF